MVDCRSESDGNLPRNMSTSNGTHNAPTKAAIKIKCDVTDEGTPVGDTIDREMVHAADHCGGRSSSFSSNHSDVRINAPDNSQRTAAMVGVFVLAVISVWTCPSELNPPGEPTIQQVWYYGWITAVSTGLGVLPLVFVPNLDKFWIGVSNAIAAGMMVAASYSLIWEGCDFAEADDRWEMSSSMRTTLGVVLGLVFILGTKRFLDTHENYKVGSLGSADAKKIILIMFVMTLHSFSEGVGIGVSFGGLHGKKLGTFISCSLAAHNVPEGLAVAIVLLPRKVSKLSAFVWCILTSIPQPVMAVPAFLFVNSFVPILPVGLGFAGGAMAWVALFELLPEAHEDTNTTTTCIVSFISMGIMLAMQRLIKDE